MKTTPRAALLAGAFAAYFAAFILFVFITLWVWAPAPPAVVVLTAWCGASLAIYLTYLLSALPAHNRALLALTAEGMLLDVACNYPASKITSIWEGAIMPPRHFHWPYIALVALGNCGVLLAATGCGLLVARGLKKANYLVMAAVVGALADIYSVFMGPSKHVLSSDVFFYVSFQWSVAGNGIAPCVGAGDFIFLALFFAGSRKFQLDDRKTFVAMLAAFALGFVTATITQQGIPALPFMAFMLLLVHGPKLLEKIRLEKAMQVR